jgi:DNA-binding beta-propeller fold protein YncE
MENGSWWHPEMVARTPIIILVLAGLFAGCGSFKLNPYNLDTEVVSLPFTSPISFDDFSYDSILGRVLIPAGETGQVALIDPKNMNYQLISGFSEQVDSSDPIVGATSVAVVGEFLFGLDQHTKTIKIIDLSTNIVVGSTSLQAAADYIRYISAAGELWVTEKDLQQIEIFSLSTENTPTLQSTGTISIPNGPEGLVIDDSRGLAFTNRPKQSLTDVIQVMTHRVIGQWGNGCSSGKGMAVDKIEGYLFVACSEGKLVVMDINNDGYQLTSQNYGGELDFVAFNPRLHHIYLPSSTSGIVAIFQLERSYVTPQPSETNSLEPEKTISLNAISGIASTQDFKTSLNQSGTADSAIHSKCVTSDDLNNIWVCDPDNGQVLVIHDTFPDTGSIP